jgi:hypothetical protein
VGSIDTYTLFTRNPLTARTPYAVQWRIYEDGAYIYPVGGGFASGTEATPIPWSFSTPGYKYFQFIISDPDFWFKPDTIVAKVLVMKQVTDLNINMPTLCLETFPTGEDYKFTVETVPPIETVFPVIPSSSVYWTGSHCETQGDLQLDFKFEPHPLAPFTKVPLSEFGNWSSLTYGQFYLGGYTVPVWPMTSLPLSPWADVKKFYYPNTDIMSYAGTYNMPIIGTFSYNDGINTIKKNYFISIAKTAGTVSINNGSSYLIHEYNKTSSGTYSTHTAEPFGTIDAPAHEIWTPTDNPMVNEGYGDNISTIRIKDKLVIGKGQSLTIKNMTVEMGKDAQIIVESDPAGIVEAGSMILDNATIKAYRDCANESSYWDGIVLQGNSSQSQENIGSIFKRYQAMMFMSNNSKIAEAKIAVRTYDPANASTRAGGIVYAYNSSFENNQVAVDIAPYYNTTLVPYFTGYAAKFDNCTFSFNNNDLMSDFEGFVRMDAVKDIPFYSCHFTTDFGSAMKGYGIKAYDASVLVRGSLGGSAPCYFKGLQEGVSANKVAFGTSNTLYINNTNFAQNYSGVYSRAINNSYMHNNSFLMPARPSISYAGRNCTGVNIETGSGYTLTNNSFSNTAATPTSAAHNNAVLVWNSGSADNFVKDNTVSNLSQGMISNYINRGTSAPATGLQFLCNAQSNNVGTCIAALGTDPTQDGMRAEQGSNSRAAGNTFAHLLRDIYNPTAQVGAVNYFHNSLPNAEPTLNVGGVSPIPTIASDGCAASTLPISTSPITTASGTMGTAFFGLPTPVTSTSGLSGIALREALLHNVAAYSFPTEMPDRISLLHSTYAALGDAYSDLERVDLYLQSNEIEAANTLYDGIVANRSLSGTEAYEFSHWGRMLLDISIELRQANKSSKEINAAQISSLSLIADSARMWAKVRAQNWLQLYDGRSSINTFLYPPISSGGNQRQVLKNSLTGGDAQQNAVYPNPAKTYIDVVYRYQNEKANAVVLEIRDMMGRIVLTENINNTNKQRVNIEKLPASVYLYRIVEDGEAKAEGKLTKQ